MKTFEEALSIVLEKATLTGCHNVPLDRSTGCVLRQDVRADINMPPFDKSAMDGYACRQEDLPGPLMVIENIYAGQTPKKQIARGQCAKIMTGAMVPKGADCVVMVEHTEHIDDHSIRFTGQQTKSNICYQAEDIRVGDTVLKSGSLIKPEHVAVMATLGVPEPVVAVSPRTGILPTGSELVEPSEEISGAMIRNSNGWQLAAQAQEIGCHVTRYRPVTDTEKELEAAIRLAVRDNDVVILSGGVSMGDLDLVPDILQKIGVKILFTSVGIQPGRPSTFGVLEDTVLFGLPGNPVSTYMQFQLMIKPFLYKKMGHDFQHRIVAAEMEQSFTRRKTTRALILPVRFTSPDTVTVIDYHGSAHINALCHADGAVIIPVGQSTINKGTRVDVRQF